MRSPVHHVPSAEAPTAALAAARLRHSREHAGPSDARTGASAAHREVPGVRPWAQRFSVLQEEADPCNRISVVRHDQRAPRPAPGDRDRPQSVFLARLAPKKWRSYRDSVESQAINATHYFRRRAQFSNTVVLAITAHSDEGDRDSELIVISVPGLM